MGYARLVGILLAVVVVGTSWGVEKGERVSPPKHRVDIAFFLVLR